MGEFFIHTGNGHVATRAQLVEAGVVGPADQPPRPWLAIQGPRDASTLWYAVLRKRTRGIVIGTLCIRHSPHQASLLRDGWEEVTVQEIRAGPARAPRSADST